ncbi:MAG: aldolase [Luteitalea sp.]|nr:aldolase [Luteitalea sp.]
MQPLPRLHRLFDADGKCFDVALDHGFFNERAFLEGIRDIPKAIRTIIDAAPDAIQLSPGQAVHLQSSPGPRKPALVMRTDVANVYGSQLPRTLFSQLTDDAVTQAVRLDAACVVVNLLLLPDQPELHQRCVENICRLKPACEVLGMPLMVEPLVMQANEITGGYMVDGNLDKILPLVRQAVELGANVIKADPCDDLSKYCQVVEVAGGVPVLVRGGGKAAEEEILERTFAVIQQGASGIVYGRNIIQHEHPALMTRALMAIVHDGATPDQALKLLRTSR